MKVGGLPYAVTMDRQAEKLNTYLEGIYNTVIVKDIEERQSRKEKDPARRKVTAEETFEREMKPLRRIKDNYEKLILTLDRLTPGNYEGIKVVNAADWLLGK